MKKNLMENKVIYYNNKILWMKMIKLRLMIKFKFRWLGIVKDNRYLQRET